MRRGFTKVTEPPRSPIARTASRALGTEAAVRWPPLGSLPSSRRWSVCWRSGTGKMLSAPTMASMAANLLERSWVSPPKSRVDCIFAQNGVDGRDAGRRVGQRVPPVGADRLGAVLLADGAEPLADLPDGVVPRHPLERRRRLASWRWSGAADGRAGPGRGAPPRSRCPCGRRSRRPRDGRGRGGSPPPSRRRRPRRRAGTAARRSGRRSTRASCPSWSLPLARHGCAAGKTSTSFPSVRRGDAPQTRSLR